MVNCDLIFGRQGAGCYRSESCLLGVSDITLAISVRVKQGPAHGVCELNGLGYVIFLMAAERRNSSSASPRGNKR